MASTDSFFTKLIGIHDMTVNGGSLLPRRFLLNFTRGLVEDVDGATQITASDSPVWLDTFTLGTDQDDYTATGFAGATEVPFDPAIPSLTITGFEATGLTVYEKRIWNLSASIDFEIAHNDSGSVAANRVLTTTGAAITVSAGNAVKLVRAADNASWRALPCLI